MKKKLNIGLDIGVASLGWSLIDEDNKIINLGSRLFPDAANPKDGKLLNAKRREMRHSRRRISRTRTRKQELISFFVDNKLIKNEEEVISLINYDINKYNVSNPIELKVKALKEVVSNDELIIILFHYIHHRGFFYLTDEMIKENPDLLIEDTNLTKYPSNIVFDFYKKNGYYKDSEITKNISKIDYVKEIRQILKIQNKSEEFINGYLNIFNKIRDFATGPGSEKAPTKYGMYRLDENKEVYKIEGESLWENTIGKCTYFKDERRGGKNSPIAEIFNLLNDLNNIYLNKDKKLKLSPEIKQSIFNEINKSLSKEKPTNKKVTSKLISSLINKNNLLDNISVDEIYGQRINKDGKEIFTEINNFTSIAKFLKINKKISHIDVLNIELIKKINSIFDLLSKNSQDAIKRIEIIASLPEFNFISKESIKELVKNTKSLSATHSLSYKAMISFIEEIGIKENKNQMQYFTEKFSHNKIKNENSKELKYIPKNLFQNEIISPTTRRAFNQTVSVLNKILKNYSNEYEINNITIEMPRDKNSSEERKAIEKQQKRQTNNKSKIKSEYGVENINAKTRARILLWEEQNKEDIYSGEEIKLNDILNHNSKYDIDHIIPYSMCFIDGFNNKVLTSKENNARKSNKTPYQWLSQNGNYEKYKQRVEQSKLLSKKKKEMLLFENDPTREVIGFIERNLVDTRYASKAILNILTNFSKESKSLYPDMKIKVVNGSMTNYTRYNLFGIPKNRDDYSHHAVDAIIINYLGSNSSIAKLIKYENINYIGSLVNDEYQIIDQDTGEIISTNNIEEQTREKQETTSLTNQMKDFHEKNQIKFSRPIIRKTNMPWSDETIYSFKWKNENEGFIVSSLNLIKESKESLSKYFDEENKLLKKLEKLFCFNEDPVLYNKLFKIYNQYKDSSPKNPFLTYMQDYHKQEKPQSIKLDSTNVKSLRIKGDPKDSSKIIILNKHNNNAVQKSINLLEIRIYKNDQEKYITIPINIKVLKLNNESNKLEIDNLKLKKVLETKNISDFKKYMSIQAGVSFINKNNDKIIYSNGGGQYSSNVIEVKNIFAKTEKRNSISVSSLAKEYDYCELDVLGNIYNRISFENFFK